MYFTLLINAFSLIMLLAKRKSTYGIPMDIVQTCNTPVKLHTLTFIIGYVVYAHNNSHLYWEHMLQA